MKKIPYSFLCKKVKKHLTNKEKYATKSIYKHVLRRLRQMNEYPSIVKQRLITLINEMSAEPAPFVKNPQSDFTRKRKLPFETVVQLLLSMGGNSIYKDLLETQCYGSNTATTSAFIHQRDKILPFAFQFLFRKFTDTLTDSKTYKEYRLFAADGSDLHISADPNDTDTYIQNNPDGKGYNFMHLNTIVSSQVKCTDFCHKVHSF